MRVGSCKENGRTGATSGTWVFGFLGQHSGELISHDCADFTEHEQPLQEPHVQLDLGTQFVSGPGLGVVYW